MWPKPNNNELSSVDLPETKPDSINLHSIQVVPLFDFERFSSFIKLQRVCAYLLRFLNNARAATRGGTCMR